MDAYGPARLRALARRYLPALTISRRRPIPLALLEVARARDYRDSARHARRQIRGN
jgi:hypothetical protein